MVVLVCHRRFHRHLHTLTLRLLTYMTLILTHLSESASLRSATWQLLLLVLVVHEPRPTRWLWLAILVRALVESVVLDGVAAHQVGPIQPSRAVGDAAARPVLPEPRSQRLEPRGRNLLDDLDARVLQPDQDELHVRGAGPALKVGVLEVRQLCALELGWNGNRRWHFWRGRGGWGCVPDLLLEQR